MQYYAYATNIYCSDIKDLEKIYDAVIIDLPYNLYSHSTDEMTLNIIHSASKLANRVIIVSISDI